VSYIGTVDIPGAFQYDSPEVIPDIIVELPYEFKGKNFKVSLSLANTDNISGYAINGIDLEVMNIDYANAYVTIRGRTRWIDLESETEAWTGCQVNYFATY
jgi:hypothetical protein